MIILQIARPNPVPFAFVVTNGSKMLASLLGSIPGPVSCNEMEIESGIMTCGHDADDPLFCGRGHCLDGVLDQVKDDLSKLASVALDQPAILTPTSCGLRYCGRPVLCAAAATASSANAFMSTGWCSCLPPLNKLRKFSNTSFARKPASFIWSKRFFASAISGERSIQKSLPGSGA